LGTLKWQRNLKYAIWLGIFSLLFGISLKIAGAGEEFYGFLGLGGFSMGVGIGMIVLAYFLKWYYKEQ